MIDKEKFGLDEHIEVMDKSISPTYEEETYFLDSDSILALKRYM
jgi:hypothetical protein